jgi:hypothetical protein
MFVQDAGVVHDDVEAPEGVDRLLDHLLRRVPVAHVGAVHDRLAARCLDLVDDLLRRGRVGAGAVAVATEVVHDDLGALLGEHERVLAPDATPGAGDDGHSAFTHACHVRCSLSTLGEGLESYSNSSYDGLHVESSRGDPPRHLGRRDRPGWLGLHLAEEHGGSGYSLEACREIPSSAER